MGSDIYKRELEALLTNMNATPAQITYTRGRYIVALSKDIKNTNDIQTKNNLQREYINQMSLHQNQLNQRISETRKEKNSLGMQITNEISLKNKKVVNSVRQFTNSTKASEYILNGTKVTANTISATFSIVKTPLMATIKLASLAAPVLTTIAVQPLHIPAYLFSKIINPSSQYNGQIITSMGKQMGNLISSVLNMSNEAIRRI